MWISCPVHPFSFPGIPGPHQRIWREENPSADRIKNCRVRPQKGQDMKQNMAADRKETKNETACDIRELTLNELIGRLGSTSKLPKIPNTRELRDYAEVVFQTDSYIVYSNGYVVYQNDWGRTVLFLSDCTTYTYHFAPLTANEQVYQTQSERVDSFGNLPWMIGVTVRGDHQIEINGYFREGKHIDADSNEEEENDNRSGCRPYRYPNPEDEYIRKEGWEEKLERLTEKQKQVFILSRVCGYTEEEIAAMLRIRPVSVSSHLIAIRKKIKKVSSL